jgi:hypothetical protein
MSRRRYSEYFSGTARFTLGTRTCLERAVGRALFNQKGNTLPLRSAVGRATRELRSEGLNAEAVLSVLGVVVEGAGYACGADRVSLISGEPGWIRVRTKVLESARLELAAPVE